jgi:hypothetical protein
MLEQHRTDAARERDELREAFQARAAVLEEARTYLRARAERAERELDRARTEPAGTTQETDTPKRPARRTKRNAE